MRVGLALALAGSLVACGDDDASVDGGGGTDSGRVDAGGSTLDAAQDQDGGAGDDGSAQDGSTALDSGADGAAVADGGAGSSMGFFITSVGPGDGANLGGLSGADQHCQRLAEAANAGGRTWRAYLSQSGSGARTVHARDRIGEGPWLNANGVTIAANVRELHGTNALDGTTGLTETGTTVPGRGAPTNQHDILTGSTSDGMAFPADPDRTCDNWTSNDTGSAQVGHHDRVGGGADPTSWNSAHASRGCSQSDLVGTGGNGYFYCFAAD